MTGPIPIPATGGFLIGRVARAVRGLVAGDPLLRNGHLLMLSSLVTGVFGVAFWSIAAHRYPVALVGEGAAAVSALGVVGGVAQLNLMSVLVRFVPTQGPLTRRLVLRVYGVSVAGAGVLAGGFLWLSGSLSAHLQYFHSPAAAVPFMLAAVLWPVSVLQDSALTGLRHPGWVVTENTVLAVVKVALVLLLATVIPASGIVTSWAVALAVSVVIANGYLFTRALPAHASSPVSEELTLKGLVRFAAPDYVAGLSLQAAIGGLPLVIVALAGAEQNAYFSVGWNIAYMLYLVSTNMGYSLIVESATKQDALTANFFRVIRHLLPRVVAAVVVVVVAAPFVLRIFGASYAAHGTTVLRLLALSAIPNVVTCTVCNVARAQRRTGVGLAVTASLCLTVVVLSVLLLPGMGVQGVALAWLVGQVAVAAAVILLRRLWMPTSSWAVPAQRHGVCGVQSAPCGGSPASFPSLALLASVASFASRGRIRSKPVAGAALAPVAPGLDDLLEPARAVLATMGLSDPGADVHLEPMGALSDVSLAAMVGPGGPVAVLKRANSTATAGELRAEHELIDGLRGHPGAHHLGVAVPTSCYVEHPQGTFSVQSWIAGIDGCTLLRTGQTGAGQLASETLDWAQRLHRLAPTEVEVGDDLAASWVDDPLAKLQLGKDLLSAGALRRAQALGDELRSLVTGSRVTLGWTHGDLWLGNVMFSEQSQLAGVVDWGEGGVDLIEREICHLGLMTWALASGRTFGSIVARCLRAGRWSPLVTGSLGIAPHRLRMTSSLDERTVLLLTWLRHVSTNLSKCERHRFSPAWLMNNVERVLREQSHRRAEVRG